MWRKNYIRSLLSVPLLVLFATGSVQAQGNVQLSPATLTVPFFSGNASLSLISGNSDTNVFVFELKLTGVQSGTSSSPVSIIPTPISTAAVSSVTIIDSDEFFNLTFIIQAGRVDLQVVLIDPPNTVVGIVRVQFLDTPTQIAFFEQVTPTTVTATVIVGVFAVGIDIHPGSFPNSINLDSGGVTPVAILGSASLDVNDIDLTTLTLGTAGIKTVGKTDRTLCSVQDVSGDFSLSLEGAPDGFDDLVCKFITVNIVPEVGDTEAKLMGDFISGGSFEGTDSVNIVP